MAAPAQPTQSARSHALMQVLQTPLEFNIVASSLDELRPVVMRGWADKHDLAEGLKASATVPQLAGAAGQASGMRHTVNLCNAAARHTALYIPAQVNEHSKSLERHSDTTTVEYSS